METIWKYEFALGASGTQFSLNLPKGATILTAQMQGDAAVMWALVDTEMVLTKRAFVTYWTGNRMRDCYHHYINTVTTPSGLVYHLFELLD